MCSKFILLSGIYIVAFIIKNADSCPDELGCFKDDINTPALPYWGGKVHDVDQCVKKCKGLKYRFAGLQFGFGCWCGTDYAKYGTSTQCNTKCRSGKMCGGATDNSVYKAYMIDCFRENPAARCLPHYENEVSNPKECIDKCGKKKYEYAGLQMGKFCWCGTNYAKYGKSKKCKGKCASRKTCGGSSEMRVFRAYLKPTAGAC